MTEPKVYRKDDAFYVETGACTFNPPVDSYWLTTKGTVEKGIRFNFDESRSILRRLPLTLPLCEGQIVLCRDGVERTCGVIHHSDRPYIELSGVFNPLWIDNGTYWDDTRHHQFDALADSPRWKPADITVHNCDCACKRCQDAREKQAAAAGEFVGKAREQKAPDTKPAAAPAILQDDAAFYEHVWGFPKPFEVGVKPKAKIAEECPCCLNGRAYRIAACPECGGTGRQKI